jgi:hypothetical protein
MTLFTHYPITTGCLGLVVVLLYLHVLLATAAPRHQLRRLRPMTQDLATALERVRENSRVVSWTR